MEKLTDFFSKKYGLFLHFLVKNTDFFTLFSKKYGLFYKEKLTDFFTKKYGLFWREEGGGKASARRERHKPP